MDGPSRNTVPTPSVLSYPVVARRGLSIGDTDSVNSFVGPARTGGTGTQAGQTRSSHDEGIYIVQLSSSNMASKRSRASEEIVLVKQNGFSEEMTLAGNLVKA